MNNISEVAMKAFLEQNGIYSEEVSNKHLVALKEGESFPSVIITNMGPYQNFCRTVGLDMVSPLLNLVFHERNHFQDPWKLVNLFRAFSSNSLSVSTVIDLFNHLEDGPRKQYVQQYMQHYKASIGINQNVNSTIDAFGSFAGLLIQAVSFVEGCFNELSQHKYQYYNKLCHATVKHFDASHLQLEFVQHHNTCGIGAFYQVKDLTQLVTMASCGNETYVRHILDTLNQMAMNTQSLENRKQIYTANEITHQLYSTLLQRAGIKPVLFTSAQLTKGI